MSRQNELIKLTTVWFEILCKLAISQSAINKETIHILESSWVDVLGYFTAWPVYRGWDGCGWLGLYLNPPSTWYSYWVSAWQPKFSKTTLLWRSEYGTAENSWCVGWGDRDGPLGRAAALWSSLGERVRRWLGEGPEGQNREEAGGRKTPEGCHLKGTAIWRWSVVGAWGGSDRNTDGELPLVNSTSHTPKLSAAL